jgi:NAD+ dependent glucose-6-phosphate dehydrogenase
LAARTRKSFIALRIGHHQHAEGNIPGPHMQNGLWGQRMWVSDRDLCQAIECAVRARDVPFAVLNVMSANPGMRWDIEHTGSVIGYAPEDRHVAVSTPEIAEGERRARLEQEIVDRLEQISAKW